jgi:hypothetical protein
VVPRTIHRIWLGSDEPVWSRRFARTWQRPGWTVTTYYGIPADLAPLANQRLYDEAPLIAPDHVGQLRSDILRLELLNAYGGVYVDADFECLRPIDSLLEGIDCFMAWEVPGRFAANGIMGAEAEHPFIRALIGGLEENIERHLRVYSPKRRAKPNRLSGPQYVTRMLRRRGDVTVFDRDLFYPFGWEQIADFQPNGNSAERFPDAFAVHWWNNKRREGRDPSQAMV